MLIGKIQRSTRFRGGVLATAVAIVAGILLAAPTAAADPAANTTECRNVSVPVTANKQQANITGTLCVPPEAETVQVLIHGWTYARYYWDSPYEPDTYSYVRAANRRGYATLAIDRLGAGQSSHLLSAFNTFYADVHTVHQVITALREGDLGPKFNKVISVGHSLGGIVTMTEAGVYKDVDAIIPTGIAHSLNYVNLASKVLANDYPATLDEKFADSGLDVGYVTSYPGTRKGFYLGTESSTDPEVIAMDEEMKDTGNLVEFATVGNYNFNNANRTTNIPVFAVVGQQDLVICGLLGPTCDESESLAEFERPFYSPDATVEALVVPNTGHDLQLERSAPSTTEAMLDFSDRHIGAGEGKKNTEPGSAPEVPTPPNPEPTLAQQLINETVTAAIVPLLELLQESSNTVPGVGDNVDPIPGVAEALSTIGNLVDELVGPFPQELIEGS